MVHLLSMVQTSFLLTNNFLHLFFLLYFIIYRLIVKNFSISRLSRLSSSWREESFNGLREKFFGGKSIEKIDRENRFSPQLVFVISPVELKSKWIVNCGEYLRGKTWKTLKFDLWLKKNRVYFQNEKFIDIVFNWFAYLIESSTFESVANSIEKIIWCETCSMQRMWCSSSQTVDFDDKRRLSRF